MGGGDGGGAGGRRDRMAAAARSLEKEFEGRGFALLVFGDDARDGRIGYISNRPRGAMLEALRAFVAAHGAAAAVLGAADRERLADLARRAAAHPADRRVFADPVRGPGALRALASLRVEAAGVVVAFSHDLTPPDWEPVLHLSVAAPDGSPPAPALVREIARGFGMEGCRFRPAPPPHGGEALHAFLPVREAAVAAAAADDDPADRPRWTN
ncbi:hypothetical protein GCM10009416_28170 [Craurococcus roseus]|uniref:Uncharacterized protein n=1 Tax=Craurococcus roseus TaxID=77585 RepID=A0ABN1FCJ7_9PROT